MSVLESSARTERGSPIKRFVADYPRLAFAAIALVMTWLVALPFILVRANSAVPMPPEPIQILGALAGPTLAAWLVTFLREGLPGLQSFLKRYIQWRVGLVWWLLVIFGPLLALNLVASLFLGPTIWTNLLQNLPMALITFLLNLVFGIILGPLWEEPGWRGFALPRLQKRNGPLVGTVLLGILWGVWHLPGFFGGWLPPLTLSSFAALLVATIGFSLVMTWIYNNTGGSILLMIVLHSANNAAIGLGGKILPPDIPVGLQSVVANGWLPAIASLAFGVLVVILTKGKLAYQVD